jgi:hypothetical protein
MTAHRSDSGANFSWSEEVLTRIEGRAHEIRRRRRSVFSSVSGVLAVVGVIALGTTLARSGPPDQQVGTTGADPTSELAQLLPTPSSIVEVFPQLQVRAVPGGRGYGVTTPAELGGIQGANLGVNRQWVSDPASLQLQPGEQFPDKVVSVVSAVTRFDGVKGAQAWTRQSIARVPTAVHLSPASTTPGDVVMVRGPGDLPGQLQYLAVFTDENTAFSLMMITGSSGDDAQFVRLVQDWVRQTPLSAIPSTVRP